MGEGGLCVCVCVCVCVYLVILLISSSIPFILFPLSLPFLPPPPPPPPPPSLRNPTSETLPTNLWHLKLAYVQDFYVLQSLSTYYRESSLSSLRGLGTTDNTPLTSAAASSPNTSITGPIQVRREGGRSGGVEGGVRRREEG